MVQRVFGCVVQKPPGGRNVQATAAPAPGVQPNTISTPDIKVSPGQRGRVGEAAASKITGAGKNNETFTVNGRDRIPDQVLAQDLTTRAPTQIAEVKNVRQQSLTRQLRDDVDLVGPGGKVDVFLPPGAKVSGPLQRAFDDPLNPLNRRDLPPS